MKDIAAGLPPASKKREEIIRFIIHGMAAYVNERKTGIKGIRLYILTKSKEEENLVRIALYAEKPGAFKEEELERKLSDHYINPDAGWYFEFETVPDHIPECQYRNDSMGLDIIKESIIKNNFSRGRVTILSGQAEHEEYLLDPAIKSKYKIGRGKNPVLTTGMMHSNDIVFIAKEEEGFDETKGAANLTVSRFHASIIFKPEQNKFYIAAEAGGVASKTKLFSENGKMIRLQVPGALHELADNDQAELGGSVRILFKRSS
ncbi:MAG: FHA domain-containing protein [Chitinophagaceae bacterium]|nr:FHA domain-containing protein [Chitinophagaceae bacterium]